MNPFRMIAQRLGYDVVPIYDPDIDPADRKIAEFVRPYTLTSVARIISLIGAVRYVTRHQIPGAIAECGVWRGGSMMTVARTLMEMQDTTRELFLYDTFTGMTPPTDVDERYDNLPGKVEFAQETKGGKGWVEVGKEEVSRNLALTGYPQERFHLIAGKVEETIPSQMPGPIALLRLDTDWYESTIHELRHLFPLVAKNGIIIIDDYGWYKGARKATDEYLAEIKEPLLLQRIDYTGRLIVKTF